MPIIAGADLFKASRDYRLLDQTQFDSISVFTKENSSDARAVAKELLQRGWITAFQANLLLQGRGAS